MAKSKIAITLDDGIVGRIDTLVRQREYPNRSQAIEEAVREKPDRLELKTVQMPKRSWVKISQIRTGVCQDSCHTLFIPELVQ